MATKGEKIPPCSNYNEFTSNWRLDTLLNKVDSVSSLGTIYFDELTFDSKIRDVDNINAILGLNIQTTFELVHQTQSRIIPDMYYAHYQQYYNGIKVEPGGYIIHYFPKEDDLPPGPGTGGGPCDRIYSMIPNICSNIHISTTASIDTSVVHSTL